MRKQPGFIMAVNFFVLMVIYMLSRWFFYYMNIASFQDVTFSDMMTICQGGIRFDLSTLCYLNLLCILLQFLPLKRRHSVRYQQVVKILFIIINSLGLAVNAADIVYFEFGGRRTTSTIFSEFGSESNLGTIFLNSITSYWQVWLFGIATIVAVILLYYNPIITQHPTPNTQHPSPFSPPFGGAGGGSHHPTPKKLYYPVHTVIFLIAMVLTIGGLRGGLGLKMHPLRQDSANIYCKNPQQAAIVLNTPFTLITTIHKTGYKDPHFTFEEDIDSIFNPIKRNHPSLTFQPSNISTFQPSNISTFQHFNIIVLLLESFSMEYTGYFNKDKDGGKYQGYTPFLDSLLTKSYCFQYSFANGIRSVDCMPAVFAGIPRYIDPYCYFFYSNNTLQGLPAMLRDEGYTTAFFHGAPNTTLGFKGFTNSIGFENYYGMDEYGNDKDFDGTWAIFDEPYLDYFAKKCDEIANSQHPFLATVFTASSHEPFTIPDAHKDKFTRGKIPMHNAISYTDYSLQRFFDQVKDKPWAANTIFVLTADHTGVSYRDDYNNEMGRFLIPIFFYTPGGQIPAKCDTTRLIQQMDITPTLLGLLNYQKPYFSFGKDVFDTSPDYKNYVFNDRNGQSMYYLDDLMIEYSGGQLIGIYEYKKDFMLRHNKINRKGDYPQLPFMQKQMEAIIQQYVTRMKKNDLTATSQK